MKKTTCDKCNREITNSNFKRHFDSCTGIIPIKFINDEWKQVDGKYKCPYCDLLFSYKGISSHIIFKHTEFNNTIKKRTGIKSNFTLYNSKVRSGEIVHEFTNQYVKAKKLGLPKPIVSEESHRKRSEAIKGKTFEERFGTEKAKIAREKISKSRSEYIKTLGVGGFKNTKVYRILNINNVEFCLRGTWEVKVATWLNAHNILWVGKNELLYDDNGIQKRYLPDFYLPNENLFIEVKGYYDEKNRMKIKNAVTQNNVKLYLFFNSHIKQIEKDITFNNLMRTMSAV